MEFKRVPPQTSLSFYSLISFSLSSFFQTALFFLPATRLDHTTRSSIRASREQRPKRDYRGEPAVRRSQFVTESRSLQINPIPLPTSSQLDPVTWSRVTPMTSTAGIHLTDRLAVTLASYSRRPATIILLVETKRISATRPGKTLTFCTKLNWLDDVGYSALFFRGVNRIVNRYRYVIERLWESKCAPTLCFSLFLLYNFCRKTIEYTKFFLIFLLHKEYSTSRSKISFSTLLNFSSRSFYLLNFCFVL